MRPTDTDVFEHVSIHANPAMRMGSTLQMFLVLIVVKQIITDNLKELPLIRPTLK